jgi:hypothetical protein
LTSTCTGDVEESMNLACMQGDRNDMGAPLDNEQVCDEFGCDGGEFLSETQLELNANLTNAFISSSLSSSVFFFLALFFLAYSHDLILQQSLQYTIPLLPFL